MESYGREPFETRFSQRTVFEIHARRTVFEIHARRLTYQMFVPLYCRGTHVPPYLRKAIWVISGVFFGKYEGAVLNVHAQVLCENVFFVFNCFYCGITDI